MYSCRVIIFVYWHHRYFLFLHCYFQLLILWKFSWANSWRDCSSNVMLSYNSFIHSVTGSIYSKQTNMILHSIVLIRLQSPYGELLCYNKKYQAARVLSSEVIFCLIALVVRCQRGISEVRDDKVGSNLLSLPNTEEYHTV